MIFTTRYITAWLLHSYLVLAQKVTATDGSIVYVETTEAQTTETYTFSNNVYHSVIETTYWSQIGTAYSGNEELGPVPAETYTSKSVVYVVMTGQIATSEYVDDDGTWSYVSTSFLVTLGMNSISVTASDTATAFDTTTYAIATPSLSLATATTELETSSTSTVRSESAASPSDGLIAGCVIGGIAFIVIMLLTGWIIYLQRRMNSKTKSNHQADVVPVSHKQKFGQSTGPDRSSPAYQAQASYKPTGISQVGLQTQDPNILRSPLEPHYARKIELSA